MRIEGNSIQLLSVSKPTTMEHGSSADSDKSAIIRLGGVRVQLSTHGNTGEAVGSVLMAARGFRPQSR